MHIDILDYSARFGRRSNAVYMLIYLAFLTVNSKHIKIKIDKSSRVFFSMIENNNLRYSIGIVCQ
ncbi:hypothetical protein [Pseudomonas phage vB_Pa-PAC2]